MVDGCMMSHFSSLYHAVFQASWMCHAKFVSGIFRDHENCRDSSFCCCLWQPSSCWIWCHPSRKRALSSFVVWKMRRTRDGWAQIHLIRGADSDKHHSLLCKAGWGQMQTPTAGFPSLGWCYWSTSSHPTAEVGKQVGHEMCPAGLSPAHGGASQMELLTSSSSWTLQGEGTMRRVLTGAKNQWVHGSPWLSCVTFPAISLELECSREPVWGTLETCTKVGSITDLAGIAVGWVSWSQMHQGWVHQGVLEKGRSPHTSQRDAARGKTWYTLVIKGKGITGALE